MQMVKVFGLMTGLTVLLVGFGAYFGGSQGAVLFLVLAAVMNFGMYWYSDRAVLKMYRARVLEPQDAPDLYRMVDTLRQRAGLPMPRLALAPSEQPNAFATGRNPANSLVCVTAGILRLLPPRELEGVIAHELAHIKHRHMLVGTIAATLAGAVTMLASIVRWGMIFGMGGRGDRDQNPIALLVMAIVAPLAAMIVQMAISRQNEFQADATAAGLTGDARGLAGALQRIEGYAARIPIEVSPSAAHLAIINPLAGSRRQAFAGLFRTHPPTEQRVARLEALQL
jgi:heat shock protein HtpX